MLCSQDVRQRMAEYRSFFAPLASLEPSDRKRIRLAYVMAENSHAGQVRADGSDYFGHPKGAAKIFIIELGGRDPRVIADLLMHDTLEDTGLAPYRIILALGADSSLDICALTKLSKEKESLEQYIGKILVRGPWVIISKLCDNLHNLRTLGPFSQEKREKQIAEGLYYARILIPALRLYGSYWQKYAEVLERKINQAIAMY